VKYQSFQQHQQQILRRVWRPMAWFGMAPKKERLVASKQEKTRRPVSNPPIDRNTFDHQVCAVKEKKSRAEKLAKPFCTYIDHEDLRIGSQKILNNS
jgi:hypothetical protein